MTTATAEKPGTDIVAAVTQNPAMVLLEPLTFDDLYEHIKAEADALEPDTSTEKGRKAIASMAFKIARTKTAIDDAGKELNAAKRKEIDAVDAERRKIRAKLDALRDEVYKPLTEWKNAETARQERVEETRGWLTRAAVVLADVKADFLTERLETVRRIRISTEIFGEDAAELAEQRTKVIATLETAIERAQKQEAERAELERLRQEKEERDARDALEAKQKESAERALNRIAQLARTDGEDLTIGALQRRRDTLSREFGALTGGEYGQHIDSVRAAERAADRALAGAIEAMQAEAERKAKEAEEEARRQAAEEARERAEAEAARRERVSERTAYCAQAAVVREDDTLETLDARRDEINALEINSDLFGEDEVHVRHLHMNALHELNTAINRKKEEQIKAQKAERRQRDKEHREAVQAKARAALEAKGVGSETARAVVKAIADGEIPNVSITY